MQPILQPTHKKAFVLTHLGLGDIIMSNGLVRYLCTLYDQVSVVVKNHNVDTVKAMYSDLENIKIYNVPNDSHISPNFGCLMYIYNKETADCDVYLAGSHILDKTILPDFSLFPLCFYDDVHIPRHFFWTKSYIPKTQEAIDLYKQVEHIPYVFMHNNSSTGDVFSVKSAISHFNIDIDKLLVINPQVNIYSVGHPFYDIAQSFLQQRTLIAYSDILENSQLNILSDSSLFCFANLLNIKHSNNYVVARENVTFNHLYDRSVYSTNEDFSIRTIFRQIDLH